MSNTRPMGRYGRLSSRASGAALVFGVLSAWIAAPASAADVDPSDGQWYIGPYQINEFHAQGIDGTGVTVAVIDSAINLDVPELKGADIQVMEPSLCFEPGGAPRPAVTDDYEAAFHGTNVVSYIVGNGNGSNGHQGITGIAPKAKILFYAKRTDVECESANGLAGSFAYNESIRTAIVDAVDKGADIISFSNGADNANIDGALAYAMRHDVIVVAALNNQSTGDIMADLDMYPAISNGVVSVGSFGPGGGGVMRDFYGDPNHSPFVDVVAPGVQVLLQGSPTSWDDVLMGQGNSFATPIVAGNLALAIQKYPDATHNQIIQSLIRTTGTEPHELTYDADGFYGYGTVDTIMLLSTDPTQYEDVNPLLSTDSKEIAYRGPSVRQVYGDQGESSKPAELVLSDSVTTAGGEGASTASESGSSATPTLILGLVGLALGVLGIVIAVVASSRRRSKKRSDIEREAPTSSSTAVSTGPTLAPAGWYDQGNGTQRYWNGTAWTEHVAPSAGAQVPVTEQTPAARPHNPFEVS